MFVITNREIDTRKKPGLKQFRDTPSRLGPNELRVFDATWSTGGWRAKLLPNTVEKDVLASEYAARVTIDRAQAEKKHVVLFIHGFNNDVKAVLDRARTIEQTYRVIVVAFSWPANGGGMKGVADYLSDKRDARVSTGALDRTLKKVGDYLTKYTQASRARAWNRASKLHVDSPEERDIRYAALLEEACPFTVNLLAHSMGNYLVKQVMKSSASEGTGLIFDNVLLVAADTNREDHAGWVDRIEHRNRLYITINEDDFALAASRAKVGKEQEERLGHSRTGLDSRRATYVDFTEAEGVGRSHAYFEGEPVKNEMVRAFFAEALTGQCAERKLYYHVDRNVFMCNRPA